MELPWVSVRESENAEAPNAVKLLVEQLERKGLPPRVIADELRFVGSLHGGEFGRWFVARAQLIEQKGAL